MSNTTSPSANAKFGQLAPTWIDANVPDGYCVAAVGDIIITQPIFEQMKRSSPALLARLAKADLVVGNFEGTALDLNRFDGYPEAESGFGWLISPPEVAADLRAIGFDMMARANNHATDWGVPGMRMTDELLTVAGMACAGTGSSLSAARAPAFVNGAKARAALVSWTTTFERNTPAIDAQGAIRARPGASTLASTPIAMVTPTQWQALKDIRDAQPEAAKPKVLIDFDTRNHMCTLFGQHYMPQPKGTADASVRIHYKLDAKDQQGILLNVRQAKQTSDFTVAASHTHEPDNWTTEPPNFMPSLAHDAIDNGADIVCGHGPHQLRGIEVYNGKPILYSLGNFCFMDNAQPIVTRDEWERRIWPMLPDAPQLDPERMTPAEFLEWTRVAGVFAEHIWFESVVAFSTYGASGRVKSIALIPIELNWQGRDCERGVPRLATAEQGAQIMLRLQKLCAPFGTVVTINEADGSGVIDCEHGNT